MTMNKLLKIFISTLFNVDALDTPLGFSTIRTYEFTSTLLSFRGYSAYLYLNA